METIVQVNFKSGHFNGKTVLCDPFSGQGCVVRGIFSGSQLDQIDDFCKRHNFRIAQVLNKE